MFSLVERLERRREKKKCTWILKDLEEISRGITWSKKAICSKSVSWLRWSRTFYLRLSSSSNAFFFLCNSAATCLPAALRVPSSLLLWVKWRTPGLNSRVHLANCFLPSYRKMPHLSAATQVHSLVTSIGDLFPISSLLHSLLTSHCELTYHQSNSSLHH